MHHEIKTKEVDFQVVGMSLEWAYGEKKMTLDFDCFVNIYDLDDESAFLIGEKEVFLYRYSGEVIEKFDIDKGDELHFRYISKSSYSKSGYVIIYEPSGGRYLNEWGDKIQFELDIKNRSVGKKIGIVR